MVVCLGTACLERQQAYIYIYIYKVGKYTFSLRHVRFCVILV